jgi:hypothetical protein
MPRFRFALALVFVLATALAPAGGEPDPVSSEVTIAFFGDQGLGGDAEAVLALVRDEGADAVIHAGDFDYEDDPAAWNAQIDAFLGPDFPYFASAGNHDEGRFHGPGGYQEVLAARMNRLGIPWEGDLGVRSSFHFRDVFIVLTAPGSFGNGDLVHAPYIRDALAADDSVWSISAWHKNMRAMQVGGKSDETGWGVYEESRRGGAIVATAHEHSYSRTHLLADVQNQVVASTEPPLVLAADDPLTPEDEGRSFVFVSGLGGHSIRDQELDGPWWASVYTSDQGARSGALFGVFNYQGDPNLARFYFKDVTGQIVDDFFVTSSLVPAPPSLRIEDAVVAEGDSGSSEVALRVTLQHGSGEEVAVDYATVDGGAVAGADYESVSGRLVFSGDVTEHLVRVPVRGDTSDEGDESFFVELSAPEGAIVARARGEVAILDDDAAPTPLRLEVDTLGSGIVTLDPPGGVYPPGTPVKLTAVAAPGHAFTGWDGDLAGTANPATLLLDRDLRVGAHFSALEPSLLEVESGTAASQGSVTTAAPLVAADDDLYLAAISFKPNVAVTGVSGLGLVWSPLGAQCAGRSQTGVAVWQARGRPTADGAVTATFAEPPLNSVLTVSRYSGVGGVVRAASANSVGAAGACAGGTDGDAYALAFGTATSRSLVYVAAAARHRDHLPGPGFVERAQIFAGSAGNVAGISVADFRAGAPAPAPVAGRFSGTVDWAVVALEIPVAAPFHLGVAPSSGGSVGVDPPFDAFVPGATVTLTATPEPDHRFVGWSGDLAGAENPATLVMDSDKLVGATFARQLDVITRAAASQGSIEIDPPGGVYDEGTTVTLTAVPNPGHRFTGWSGSLTGLDNPAALVVDSTEFVIAGFVSQFTVSVAPGSGGSVVLDPPGGLYDDGSSVTLTAVPDAHHRFGGWSGVLAGQGNPATLVVEADEAITASFVPLVNLRVLPTAGGSVALDPPGGVYDQGTAVTLTALPDPRYGFTGWSGALTGSANPATLVVDRDQAVVASFVPLFSVDVEPALGGSVALDPPGGLYVQGTTVELTALPDPGYRFTGWSGALTGSANPATLVVDRDRSVGASFANLLNLMVAPAVGGSVSLDPPGGLYLPGTTVTLTALPDPGHRFTGWSGALTGSANPATLVVDRDQAVGAGFVPFLRVDVEPAVGGSVALDPPGGLYDPGTLVTLTATPAAGGIFAGWEGDLAGAGNPASVVVDRDLQVGARFLVPASLQEFESGTSAESGSVSTSAPLTAAEGHLYLAAIAFKPNVAVTGVSGLGLVWSPVRVQCAGRSQTGLAVWQARGQASGDEIVTATLSTAARNAILAVSRYANADALDVAGAMSANSLGVAGACEGGVDQDAYALEMNTTTPGGLVYVAAAMRQRDHLPGSAYAERFELYRGTAGAVAGLSLADLRTDAPGPIAVQGRFDALVDWALVALEIPASPAAP